MEHTDPDAYNTWKASHICTVTNYCGSAPGMELVGAKRIFEWSVEKYGLRYIDNYGDGDSKSYQAVKDTYTGMEVWKLECIGHVQKRVGSLLRNLKRTTKGLGGRGRLTDAIIDRLKNFYGIASYSPKYRKFRIYEKSSTCFTVSCFIVEK